MTRPIATTPSRSDKRTRSQLMTPSHTAQSVTRRTALAGLGAGGLGLALASTARQASAQEATPVPMAGHPLVGTWIVDRDPTDQTDHPTLLVYATDGGAGAPRRDTDRVPTDPPAASATRPRSNNGKGVPRCTA